jgi:hypothetical protein
MGPGRLITFPPRIWAVDIDMRRGAPTAVCRACGPLTGSRSAQRTLRAGVLHHLAQHARRDLTPAHLRTCQCGRRGCPWHRKHHGCSGPVVLTLTRSANSRTWQLADACRQCCAAMPGTAAVPEPLPGTMIAPSEPPSHTPQAPSPSSDNGTLPHLYEDSDHVQVWDTSGTWW